MSDRGAAAGLTGDDAIIREARKRFDRCVEWEKNAREHALFDQRFAEGDSINAWQWDQTVRTDRGNRPCLTHNKVRQHNLMIINDARQNKAQIKITPTGDQATYEAAQVYSGVIRRIEYQSKAIDGYTTAFFHQIQSGIGYVSVETAFCDPDSWDQEIYIRREGDPRKIYLDPDAKDYDKSDMRFAFKFVDIPREVWEEEHGKFDNPSPVVLDNVDNNWVTREHIRTAVYWRRLEDEDQLHLLGDGRVVRQSRLQKGELQQIRPGIQKSRVVRESRVEWFKLVGDRIEDRGDWAGKYIPIVPCIGEETVIDGVMDRKGHTRSQIDAQRIYNYWASAAVEQVALQTKTPYVTDARAVEGYENYWVTANVKNHPYLPFNGIGDDGQPIPPPARNDPPTMSQAYIQGMTLARQDLLDVTGQYQAELGMPSNERSGVAIQQRQRQGDTATYHYIDNQAKMIRQVGRILLDLIPKIYDVTKVMKILGEDGSEQNVVLAPSAPLPHQQVQMTPQGPQPVDQQTADQIKAGAKIKGVMTIFNPNLGKYDVQADVGPSYGTQRQEAANAFATIMSQNPAAFQVVGDFWAKNSDFPGADELADRLTRGLPPQYRPGPSPQEQQLQQQLQATQQAAQRTLQQADAETSMLKAQVTHAQEQLKDKSQEIQIKDYQAETDRLKAVGQIDPVSLQIIVRQMVQDMLATEITPMLHRHAAIEGRVQAAMAPPQAGNGGNGAPQPAQQAAQPLAQ